MRFFSSVILNSEHIPTVSAGHISRGALPPRLSLV